jgi:predicted phosphodiesterase
MQIAMISDIHGESFLLESVLKDIKRQGIDRVVCLGDAVQAGSHPRETVAKLRELGCPVIMGNADYWLLTGNETKVGEKVSEKQREIREWSLEQLSKDDLDYIRSLEPTIEVPLEKGKKLLCFHGSPASFNDIIIPSTKDEDVRKFFEGYQATFFAGGHTHTQQVRQLGSSWYINPGSVSFAYNWGFSNFDTGQVVLDPWSDYCAITSEADLLGVAFRHVPYDMEKLTGMIRSTGRPYADEVTSMYRREGSV